MLPIRILVRYDAKIADLSYLKPSDCSVVSIINDAWKEMSGKGVQLFDNWKLSVLFPWNGQRHTVISDEELMIVFETFDNQSEDEIEFEISLNPLGDEYLEEHIGLLTSNNEAPLASKNNVTSPATVEEYDSDEDDSYEVDKEIGEDNEQMSHVHQGRHSPTNAKDATVLDITFVLPVRIQLLLQQHPGKLHIEICTLKKNCTLIHFLLVRKM
ncbi:hypothetical protein ACOSQ2_007981 [Xanthoceras sorbifolium]